MSNEGTFINVESLTREGLPESVVDLLKERGIRKLTPPQSSAVRAGLLKGRNVLVTAPTASGKTLIGELALVKAFLEGRMGIYVTPLKTLASEKYEEFKFWERLGLKVGITTGDYDEPGEGLGRYDVVVATYERLDSILRLKPSWLARVGVVVVDEMHMIGDRDRGPIVELIVVKASRIGAQIVGLSATIGNPEEIAEWLDAELVMSDWRPVRLIEGFYNRRHREIVFEDGRVEKVKDGNLIKHTALQALKESYQAIIFLQARNRAESAARSLSKLLPSVPGTSQLISELKEGSPRTEVESLAPLIMHGVAYHHAGLSMNARRVIEEGFREGLIKVVTATPTLAAGINMPARRVVIYTRRYSEGYMRPISISEYKQMAGRAGRPQYDPYGEAILADVKDESEGWRYINGAPEVVHSSLINERAMRIHVLALIASGDAGSLRSLHDIMGRTLAFRQLGEEAGESSVEYILERLIEMGMVSVDGTELRATRLGSYVSRLYIDPITAIVIIDGLKQSLPVVHPMYYLALIAMTPDFSRVRIVGYRALEEEANAAVEYGHVPEPVTGVDYFEWLRAYKVARILNAWIEEEPEERIIEAYNIGSGDLRTLVETAEWLTYAASRVCEAVNLTYHAKALRTLSLRIRYGVKEELLDLTRVKGVGRVRARALYNVGIRSVEELATLDPARLEGLPGFGPRVAREVIAEARKLIKQRP